MQAVLAKMKELMKANTSASLHSFLLNDDDSIPFQLDNIQAVIGDKVTGRLQGRTVMA